MGTGGPSRPARARRFMRWNLPGCRPGRKLHGALAFRPLTLIAIFLKDPSENLRRVFS